MKHLASYITGLSLALVLVIQYEGVTHLAARYKADPASINATIRARHTSTVNYVPQTNESAYESNVNAVKSYVKTVDSL